MRRELVGAIIVGIIVISASGFGISMLLSEKQFEWSVEVGDTFTVSVNITDYFYWNDIDEPVDIYDVITLSIVSLPSLPLHTDRASFVQDVVMFTKVNISSNITLIESYYGPVLTDLLSLMILPTGEWEWFASLYEDEFDFAESWVDEREEQFTAKIEDNIFQFQRSIRTPYFPNTATTLYSVWIDMNTGLPIQAAYSNIEPLCTTYEATYIEITIQSDE